MFLQSTYDVRYVSVVRYLYGKVFSVAYCDMFSARVVDACCATHLLIADHRRYLSLSFVRGRKRVCESN
jgi:hypothetical protein